MADYSPLSQEELKTNTIAAPVEPADDYEIILPVPPDALPPPSSHPRFGTPSAIWQYKDSRGLLAEVHRFDQIEGKQVLPLSYWRDIKGQGLWRYKSIPALRPVYNLDKIEASPQSAIVIVEGEKSAEAAAKIFPSSITTTSSGGSKAWSKTSWQALSGRRILIWPDADKPGLEYADSVASMLHSTGCDVTIINSMGLAAIAPNGSKREVVQGWDAADAIEEWKDFSTLRKTAYSLSKTYEPGPSFVSWGTFTMGDEGLFTEVTRGRGNAAEVTSELVAAPFEILGATRNPNGNEWGKWLRWNDRDQRQHLKHISDATLHGDPSSLCASLADDGLYISRNQQRALSTYLSGVHVNGRVTLVSRTGWHRIGERDIFVLPHETIGAHRNENVILDSSAHGPYETRGTLQDWQQGVGTLAADHGLAILAISSSLAGPLLHLTGLEGGGLNFYGGSSLGKTSLLKCGASVWGRGTTPGYVRAWRSTGNALEGVAASATDTCLILDELGVVEARDAASAIYGLANGTGKARASRSGDLREPKTWRVMLLSSGEMPVETKLAEDRGKKTRAGQLVRVLDIPCNRQRGFGAFDNGGPDGDAAALSKLFQNEAISAYGTVGPEFVRRIMAENIDGKFIREIMRSFILKHLPLGADGQIDRAAHRLALIAAAGELSINLKLVPWVTGSSITAAAWALHRWIENRGGVEPAEIRQAVEAVRLVIEMHGESRFQVIGGDPDLKPVPNRLGWRKGHGDDCEYWIPTEIWKSEICVGLDPKFVAKTLGEQGILEKAPIGWQSLRRVNGTPTRVYVVKSAIFEGSGDIV
jgi:uncharacterized protein (DUF927 family)